MPIERIGIGCPTYRGHARVANLLESITRRNPGVDLGKLDIMIHDDGSPGDIPRSTYLALYKTLDVGVGNIHISKSSNNKGIAPAWNHLSTQLIQRGADMVILLNDDILVVDDWIRPMEYFLTNNPKAGAASWGFYWFDPVDVTALLDNPENVRPRTYDSKQVDEQGNRKHVDRWEPGNARPGRLGAPSGCCFAFTKQAYQLSGGFPDEYRSMHEESAFGFKLCKQGLPSFSPPYPFLWHQWSATFNECPELKAAETMARSRQLFCKDFGVPNSYSNHPFNYVHPRACSNIPAFEITWISKNGVQRDVSPECSCSLCTEFRAQNR